MLSKKEATSNAKKILKETNIIEILGNENIFTSYVSGSIFEGFGNSKSDIDIFILVDKFKDEALNKITEINSDFVSYNQKLKKVFVTSRNGIDFDIEIYEKGYVEQFSKILLDFSTSPHDQRYDLFHRLKFAENLVNSGNFNLLKQMMDYQKFNILPAKVNSNFYSVRVTDIMGAYEEQNFDTSFKMSLSLLESCMTAYLALKGETNPSPKWLMKKIDRYSLCKDTKEIDIYEMLSQAYEGIEFGNFDVMKDKTIKTLKCCQLLNFKCEEGIKIYENY